MKQEYTRSRIIKRTKQKTTKKKKHKRNKTFGLRKYDLLTSHLDDCVGTHFLFFIPFISHFQPKRRIISRNESAEINLSPFLDNGESPWQSFHSPTVIT